MSRVPRTAPIANALQPSPLRPRNPVAWLFHQVAALFDIVSIQFLDRFPNAVTVVCIVLLLAVAHVAAAEIVWRLGLGTQEWIVDAATAATSVLVGIPVVGFGQMQYRRARAGHIASEKLTRRLILARDEARRANQEKSNFLASMSHELRTPLNAIIGFAEILRNETFGPIGQRRYAEYAGDIHKSGLHLLSLINDVLDLSKIESGRAEIDTNHQFDLVRVIGDSAEILRVLATKNRIELVEDLPAGPLEIRGNERMMRQILMNLVSNAIKFTPENGKVSVSLRLHPTGSALIRVSDSGIGMSPDEAKVALQPFGQIDSRQSRKHQGTGLGLPIAKAMVELHGGVLSVESRPGQGTTVSFDVPRERVIADSEARLRPAA